MSTVNTDEPELELEQELTKQQYKLGFCWCPTSEESCGETLTRSNAYTQDLLDGCGDEDFFVDLWLVEENNKLVPKGYGVCGFNSGFPYYYVDEEQAAKDLAQRLNLRARADRSSWRE
jgi:hypothetical protein